MPFRPPPSAQTKWVPPSQRNTTPSLEADTPASPSKAEEEAKLRAQLAALEEQLAVARMQESLSRMGNNNNNNGTGGADPEGEYEEVVEEVEEDDAEVIVIEEFVDDDEGEEIIVVEEEVVEDDDEDQYDEYEVDDDQDEYEEVYEEIVEESVKTEEDEGPVVQIKAFHPVSRNEPPPQVPLVDPPRAQTPPVDATPPGSTPPSAGPPQPVPAGPPKAVPPGPPKPVSSVEPTALAANRANVPNEDEAKPRKKWVPMSQRFPEKFKSSDPKASKALAAANAAKGPIGTAISASDKPMKQKPLPFKQRAYPTVPASPTGQETPMEKLIGTQLLKNVKNQKVTVNAAMQGQELLCLYFGAAWMKPCKAVHQPLIDFYRLTSKAENLEIVYVSADRTLFEFKGIFDQFDFLAMPTGTAQIKNQLTKQLQIVDMPVMAVFEVSTGNIITIDAAHQVMDLPSRDKDAALALVQSWKQTKAVPVDKLKRTTKAASGGAQKGNLIWS